MLACLRSIFGAQNKEPFQALTVQDRGIVDKSKPQNSIYNSLILKGFF
jgi:hypothetical protein